MFVSSGSAFPAFCKGAWMEASCSKGVWSRIFLMQKEDSEGEAINKNRDTACPIGCL